MSHNPPPNQDNPGEVGQKPGLDSELIGRISAGDPKASAAFVAMVHDRAWRMVQDALAGPSDRRSAPLERLIRAYQRDDLQIQAALLTAQTSFHRRLLKLSQEGDVKDDQDYVTALISLAYNQWQRQHYDDKKMRSESASGAFRKGDDDTSTTRLTQTADPHPGPDHQPMLEDFYEKLVEEIHLMSSGLKPGEADVVYMRLFEGLRYEQIAKGVGKSTSGVHRICQQAVAHLRRRFRDSAP
jgi:DNA-directed RNA polymerase specialized sigma24 family protein